MGSIEQGKWQWGPEYRIYRAFWGVHRMCGFPGYLQGGPLGVRRISSKAGGGMNTVHGRCEEHVP